MKPASDPKGIQVDIVDVSYSVFVGGKIRYLLRNVNLHFEPGEMVALMGPSGAGKSTLLDLVANRKTVGMWSGEILINQTPRSDLFNRDSAYVLQDDAHIATLTVEETIKYAAWTRMPEGTPVFARDARVKQLLDMMNLSHVKDSVVGDALTKGISGGQLKRLSIAVEIVHLPNLIFLDEPTSGLDSSISLEVMGAVKNLSKQLRTCVSTIHQPSPEVYALFDRTVLVSAGRVIYSGPADEAVSYFTRANLGYKYEDGQNPAEFIIDVCGGNIYPEGWNSPRQPDELQDLYNRSPHYRKPADAIALEPAKSIYVKKHATAKLTQFKMLLHRGWLAKIRDKQDIKAQFGKAFAVGIAIGTVFYNKANIDPPFFDEANVPDNSVISCASMLFLIMMYNLMNNLQSIANLCIMDKIYRRELASYGYSAAPYWFASCFTQLPVLIATHTIGMTMLYILCGFPADASYYFFYYFILMFANLASFYFAQFLAAATGNATIAFALFPLSFLFLAIFAGFGIPVDTVPPGWSWAPYVSYARWTFQGMMVNQFQRFDSISPGQNETDGNRVLISYGFDGYDDLNSFWILILNIFAISLLTYYSLRPPITKLEKVISMPDSNALVTRSSHSGTLKETLIPKEDLDVRDERDTLQGKSTYDVAWYRTNTGEISMSKGCRLAFSELTYTVKTKKGELQLLKSVSGRAHPGEMCALMGASGAGKSTLLDVLAGRKNTGRIDGRILLNGLPRSPEAMRSSAYVMQDNVHIPVLTVLQTLTFAANLRMEARHSENTKVKRVQKVMDMLGLSEHAGTIVGGENIRGISGGQLKRLSIGVEIVNLPDLIFLDEPTTGLDSSISYEVMAAVRNLANQNRTVICTIHQPSPATYFLFDKLLLMAEGRVIYFGPSREVVNFFGTSPWQFKYTNGSNPADYVIAVAGSFLPSSKGQKVTGSELANYYAQSDLCRLFLENLDAMLSMDLVSSAPQSNDLDAGSTDVSLFKKIFINGSQDYPTSTAFQLKTLIERHLAKARNEPKPYVAAVMRSVIVSSFFGSIYWQLPTPAVDDPDGAQDYNNRLALFFFCLMYHFVSHQDSIPVIFDERLLFYRERGSKAYGALPYWVTTWILRLPVASVASALFSAIVYRMAGLSTRPGRFSFFYGIITMQSFTASFLCQFIASNASSAAAALSLTPVAIFINIIFAGFLIYVNEFQDWLGAWGPYISFFRYSFQSLVLNELKDNDDLPLGQDFIDNLGFDGFSKEFCASILMMFMFGYASLSLLGFKYIDFEAR